MYNHYPNNPHNPQKQRKASTLIRGILVIRENIKTKGP